MAITDVPEQYYSHEGRLESFLSAQPLSKRRASNVHSKALKSLKWPHSFLSPEAMAKAGFFYYPTADSPDNTVCFLCRKAIDGWEEGDEPSKEHFKHSTDCGWAIVACINNSDAELCREYPLNPRMIDARMATFGERWPHESKKGWKCKVKQLVDAGWKYTPTPESDDMATCTYCDLGLDGWEPSDKPLDEHHKRSPDCAFFSLITEYKQKSPPKKATRGRKPRASKSSRLSTQSTFTTTSEAPSFVDMVAVEGDSVLTTATNTTITSKSGKGKKPAAKAKKGKSKKEEPLAKSSPTPEPEDDDFTVKVEQAKATGGRKRASETMEESTLLATQPPPSKRRATRTRGSITIEERSLAPSLDVETGVAITAYEDEMAPPKKGRKARGSTVKSIRNISSASTASKASLRIHALDDEEIDKMLEADLNRQLTDDEDGGKHASTAPVRKATRGSTLPKANHGMFGTEAMEIDDTVIEAELEAIEVEESKTLPKSKGAKVEQTRKVSAKRSTAQKATEAGTDTRDQDQKLSKKTVPSRTTRNSALSVNDSISVLENYDSGNETDASVASQSTIVKRGSSRRGSTLKKSKGGKKAVSRNIEEIVHKSIEISTEEVPEKKVARTKKLVHADEIKVTDEIHYPDMSTTQVLQAPQPNLNTKAKGKGRALPEPLVASQSESAIALTPKRSTKELTPTPSPQSSDAENHPPSTKPSTIKAPAHQTSRVQLAVSTPIQNMSPSKRNILAGLQTSNAWTPVNLSEIFASTPGIEKENFEILSEATEKVKDGKLSSPEKKMSVEEWIVFNATLAEEKLRRECEGMVGIFEREGGRAMQVLEGIECEE